MNSKREIFTILASILVLIAAGFILYFMDRHLGAVDEAIFISLLLVPIIVYALASGRLAEFSGPGGWGAKFRAEATSQVTGNQIIQSDDLQFLEKGDLRSLSDYVRGLNPNLAAALTLRVGHGGYQKRAIINYLKTLMAAVPSTYVVLFAMTVLTSSSEAQMRAKSLQP